MGSNHRPLACKAEYGQEYTQLSGSAHASELRKPCLEMPKGAWKSLHGGSRKWFPEQPADPRLSSELGPVGRPNGDAPAGWLDSRTLATSWAGGFSARPADVHRAPPAREPSPEVTAQSRLRQGLIQLGVATRPPGRSPADRSSGSQTLDTLRTRTSSAV